MSVLIDRSQRPARRLLARSARLIQKPTSAWDAIRRRVASLATSPTVFHVTHFKAGSQWVLRILQTLVPDRFVTPEWGCSQFLNREVLPGKVYPTLYVTRERFESVRLPHRWRRFVVLRDLRDTLVSAYFSLRHSHEEMNPQITEFRERMKDASIESGLSMMCDEWLPLVAGFQRSWAMVGEPLIRYKDLLTDDVAIMQRVLIDHCRLLVSREQVEEVVLANRFEIRTNGRKNGEEDVTSHERKGVAGDWRHYFSDRLAKQFKGLYGDVLVATGYEPDTRW